MLATTSGNRWSKKFYAQNADEISLRKRDVFVAFTRLQKAKLNYGLEISYKQESKGCRDCYKSHIVSSTKDQWKLFEFESSFSLGIAFDKGYTIEMSFDI